MRAHTIPASYLCAFAVGDGSKRRRELIVIRKDKILQQSVNNTCITKDYYSTDTKTDATLFKEQETYFSTLNIKVAKGETYWERDAFKHLLLLRFRARNIMEETNSRPALVDLIRSIALPTDVSISALTLGPNLPDLVSSDNPVIFFGNSGSHPERDDVFKSIAAILAPISPRMLIVCIPRPSDFLCVGSPNFQDIHLLNTIQAKFATENLIARTIPTNVEELQALMGPLRFTRCHVATHPTHAHILNFTSVALRVFSSLNFIAKNV